MRLDRFHPWAEQTLADAKSAAISGMESGVDGLAFGTRIVLANKAQVHIQWVRTAPPSGDASGSAEKIVKGESPTPVDVPDLPPTGPYATADVERHLAALLNNGGNDELAEVRGYSQDSKLGTTQQPFGIRVLCHSGAVVFGLFRHTLGAGQQPTKEGAFKQRETL
ncbi:hypothetical protein BZB76_5271 [Actinomadura pelletieri DSM 43383]|uniref:Uncharacterized protein n=1 Tax=Actinomadura pelletieri DSM 43383 TaxID=1120940 RepID=A0A495QGE6_9ACTN|nr:hypothetical protein [Actinomadura pelletieri]RKS70791.1 hypothetical protein BZB76_5271 [Actinomadura pelletieri DSM 43383]